MSKTISEVYGVYPVSKDLTFGMEFELEFGEMPDFNPLGKAFLVKADNSLRQNGVELVFPGALSYTDTVAQIEKLSDFLRKQKLKNSFRTSTHVHINITHFQFSECAALAYLLYLIDTLLVNFCEPSRKNNRFCLSLSDATYKTIELEDFIKEARVNAEDRVKYSTINLATIGKYGSIEVRCLEGFPSEAKLKTWVGILYQLQKFSQENFKCPKDVENFFLEKKEKFLNAILGEELAIELLYPTWLDDVHYNHSLMIMVPEETLLYPYSDKYKATPNKEKKSKSALRMPEIHMPLREFAEIQQPNPDWEHLRGFAEAQREVPVNAILGAPHFFVDEAIIRNNQNV